MDTSISSVDFYPFELLMSDDPEEHALGMKAKKVVVGILEELRPILKYVVAPLAVLPEGYALDGCGYSKKKRCPNNIGDPYYSQLRGVKLCVVKTYRPDISGVLFLGENGQLFTSVRCPDPEPEHYHDQYDVTQSGMAADTWGRAKFGELIAALKQMLADATCKRETHLASIRERSEKLDEMLAILRRPST